MEDLVERKCCFCSYKYYHEKNISYISLCPRCHKDGYFESHYTKNGIKPCSIYLGAENIGKMTSDTEKNYRIVCDKFGINETICNSTNPYVEASNLLIKIISRSFGFVDFKNGKLTLFDENLHKGFTFKQFKKSAMYCGQNSERVINLKGSYYINDYCFFVALLFRHGLLHLISFVCNSEHGFAEEKKRKELHDRILCEYGLSSEEIFEWGRINSVYDQRSNVSSINMIYNYDNDEIPLFYNGDLLPDKDKNININRDSRVDNKTYILKDREKIENNILDTYLKLLLKYSDPHYYASLHIKEHDSIASFRAEYKSFLKQLNYRNNRDKEIERFFLFLHGNEFTISKLVSKKQGKEYLFSQLKYALMLEDTYYNYYLLPRCKDFIRKNIKPDEQEVGGADRFLDKINNLYY